MSIAPTTLWAHGPQLQITSEEGRIVTRSVYLDGPYEHLSPVRRAYVMPLLEFNGAWYSRPNPATDVLGNPRFFSGPGLAYGAGGTFAADEQFELAFADGLKLWDGAAFVDPGSEQLEAFRGSPEAPAATAVTADTGPLDSLAFPMIEAGYDAEAHSSARFRLLGDGVDPTSSSQDGVYLVSLQVTSSQADLAPSDPFYFVLAKNAATASLQAAAGSLGLPASQVQYVPEPASTVLLLLAGVACCSHRRRRY